MNIPILKQKRIKELGLNEKWLQEYICNDPNCLGLGDVMVIGKERTQRSGGRLDVLLRSLDEEEFFEVELMLGETDESHIIRTIEYWDLEKRKWPNRRHTAVLVAERINTRFYNVINVLSYGVPIIGIQANIYDNNGAIGIAFTKIVDSYQEPESEEIEERNNGDVDIGTQFPEILEVAEVIKSSYKSLTPEIIMNTKKWGYSYTLGGYRKGELIKRGHSKISIEFILDDEGIQKGRDILQNTGIDYDTKPERIRFWISGKDQYLQNKVVFEKLISLSLE